MSIKDVSSAASLRDMPATTRLETVHAVTGKNVDPIDSVEVSLSPEAMAQARDNLTPPTQEEIDASAREALNLRNQAIARMPTGPSLASDFYSDPATANDAVSFQAFFQNATVNADEMADALHKALTSPTQNGDYTTNAMDLALTQAKLNLVVQKYVATDYQTEASAFVAQFISDKSSQADQMTKVVLTQSSRLAESLGDRDQAQHHQDALAQLAEGTHSSQTVRNAMLSLTASTTDSEAWFSSINDWVAKNRSIPYIREIEQGHISALQEQWQSFVTGLKTDV